jgi:hypothetical protein
MRGSITYEQVETSKELESLISDPEDHLIRRCMYGRSTSLGVVVKKSTQVLR